MGVIIPEGYAQLDFRFQLSGKPDPYIFSIGVDDFSSGAGLDTDVDALLTTLVSTGHLLNPAKFIGWYTFIGCRATEMTVSGPVVHEYPRSVTGTLAKNPCPPNTALLVRKNTAGGGRRNRGRMFMPPAWIGEEDIGPLGNIDASDLSDFQTLMGGFMTDIGAAGLVPVLLHSDGGTPTVVTSLAVQSTVATQRRRLR